MASRAVKERLRQDITYWFSDGLIDEKTLNILRERYESARFGWIGVIKYLGIAGGMLSLFGILGLVASAIQSEVFAALILAFLGGSFTFWGLRLAEDMRGRYAVSSKIVLTLGVVLAGLAVVIFTALIVPERSVVPVTGLVTLPAGFFLAYRYRNTTLLILTLLGMFHWIGAWHSMWGRSTYVFSVQDPYVMIVASLLALAAGIAHERYRYPRTGRFYAAWEAMGLLYLNMSLLILSIWGYGETKAVVCIIIFTAATIAQIVLGAAWQNGLIRGFGTTFFTINIFTRFHEFFWNQLNLGKYLLAGGGLLLAAGICTEFAVEAGRRRGRGR